VHDKTLPTKIDGITFAKLLPSLITILGLGVGFTGVRFALDGKWESAVMCILVAAIFDALDGGVARLFNATSTFGAELDSLCDFVVFGIAPSMIVYLWTFESYNIKLVSWGAVLFFSICMVIRLARFNTAVITGSQTDLHKYFFVGVPAPACAIMALVTIILDFEIVPELFNTIIRKHSWYIVLYQSVIGLLMASRIPTYSLKNLQIDLEHLWLILIIFAVIVIFLITTPWGAIPALCACYIVSIPFSARSAKQKYPK
jgi:CDP-diacylglycerol--serine O-phosphatidyltransferase